MGLLFPAHAAKVVFSPVAFMHGVIWIVNCECIMCPVCSRILIVKLITVIHEMWSPRNHSQQNAEVQSNSE